MIIYDVTRLLSRYGYNTPSGIDRVDLHYFFYLAEEFSNSIFIYRYKKSFYILKRELAIAIFNELKGRWYGERIKRNGVGVGLPLKIRLFRVLKLLFNLRLFNGILSKNLKRILQDNKCVYINTSHTNLDQSSLFETLEGFGCKIVIFVHDLIPLTNPEYCRHGDYDKHLTRMLNTLKYADKVITNSKFTRKCFMRFAKSKGIALDENYVFANHLGTENFARYLNKGLSDLTSRTKPYFVSIGTIEPRKNYIMLLNIWRQLVEEMGNNCPKLYIVGKRGWVNAETVAVLERCEAIQPYVIEKSDMPDNQLAGLLAGAKALLMPSHIEGWGMPVAEALSLGVPALCSDIEVFHECGQENALFLVKTNVDQWMKAIIDICNNAAQLPLDDFQTVTWCDHFKISHRILVELISGKL